MGSTHGTRARRGSGGRIRRGGRVAAAVGVAAAVAVPAGPAFAARRPAPSYQALNLGTLSFVGHGGERANAISTRGEIVGQAEVLPGTCCTGYLHATVFVPGGTNEDLGTLTGYTGISDALAVNSRGDVAGWSRAASGADQAVVWPRGGPAVVLFPGQATGISASGLVAGTMDTAAGERAVTWDRGRLVELPVPDGATSTASGVDDGGDVVGSVTTTTGGEHAAMWTRAGLVDLGPGDALAVNNRRDVVGASGGNAVMWSGGTATVLVADAAATAISSSGLVAGTRHQNAVPSTVAFVWSGGTATDLPALNPFNSATGVNPAGFVVGVRGFNGQATAWIPSRH